VFENLSRLIIRITRSPFIPRYMMMMMIITIIMRRYVHCVGSQLPAAKVCPVTADCESAIIILNKREILLCTYILLLLLLCIYRTYCTYVILLCAPYRRRPTPTAFQYDPMCSRWVGTHVPTSHYTYRIIIAIIVIRSAGRSSATENTLGIIKRTFYFIIFIFCRGDRALCC